MVHVVLALELHVNTTCVSVSLQVHYVMFVQNAEPVVEVVHKFSFNPNKQYKTL